MGLNLSQVVEGALEDAIREAERAAWVEQNRDAQNPRASVFPLLVDIQCELLSRLETRVVVPMTPSKKIGAKAITRLNPTVKVDGTEYVLVVQDLASVPISALTKRGTSLASRRADIVAALDLLVSGI